MFYDKFFNSTNMRELSSPFNMISLGLNYLSFEGKCFVTMFSSTRIVLTVKKEKIFILGTNLKILDMDNCHTTIEGKIETISTKDIKV